VKEQQVAFQVEELSFQVIEALRPLMPRLKQRNRSLADQLERAATSVALNIAEGNHSDPGNRRARFFYGEGERERVAGCAAGGAVLGLCVG
jgi:hypothetical protein